MFAQMAGTEAAWELTRQIRTPFSAGAGASRGTRREVERFVVHPNEMKRLQTGQAVLLTKTPSARVTRVRVSPLRSAGMVTGVSDRQPGRGDQPDPGVIR